MTIPLSQARLTLLNRLQAALNACNQELAGLQATMQQVRAKAGMASDALRAAIEAEASEHGLSLPDGNFSWEAKTDNSGAWALFIPEETAPIDKLAV